MVDDEQNVRTLMSRILEGAGHDVLSASDVDSALTALGKPGAHFHAIVTDVVMGTSDGMSILEHMTERASDMAVVVVSGYNPSPARANALAERGAEFLPKPFGKDELLAALSRACLRQNRRPPFRPESHATA